LSFKSILIDESFYETDNLSEILLVSRLEALELLIELDFEELTLTFSGNFFKFK
jgi:hypothetical protein